jgi:acyl dehydratase
MTEPLFYEDLHVGQTFRSSAVPMDRDRIVAFAREFDPQPQHVDEAAAKDSVFGALVASGWHTAAVSMRLQLEAMLGRFPGGAMGAQVDTLGWRRPVHPGDTLHVVVEVLGMRLSQSRPDRGLLTLRTATINQRDETVQEMTASVLVPRRGA